MVSRPERKDKGGSFPKQRHTPTPHGSLPIPLRPPAGLGGGSCRSTRKAGPLEKAGLLVLVNRDSQGLRADS